MNSVFSEQILADKLSKLNSTQQCIETLSHWCIFHRSKAELVVTTWEKQFHSAEMVQKVPLLYLANDILQNSKRKGNEFVTEFWKVLPGALKVLNAEGDEKGKNVVSRLVGIWEERKVFGSRTKSLKELMTGEKVPPPLNLGGKKRSCSVRIIKRDSHSIRTKLSIGGAAEKIISAFHSMIKENPNEEAEMNKCKSAVHKVRKFEKDVDSACTTEDPKRRSLAKEIEEEENVLKQCFEKLKSVEASRVALGTQLREALHEQESELENVRTHMQVAQAQAEEASNMRKRLNDEDYIYDPSSTDANSNGGKTPKKSAAAIVALVADKLTASSSSQSIMASVLSSFAAEEAKKAGLTKPSTSSDSFPSTPNSSGTDSLSKPERSMPASEPAVFMSAQPPAAPANHPYPSTMLPQQQIHGLTSQAQFHMLQNPSQQYLQPSGGIMGQYVYGNIPSMPLGPPPPPPPPHMVSPMVPLSQPPLQMNQQPSPATQQQQQQQQQQQPLIQPPTFRPLQPPGMMYYSHPHHSQ